MRVSHVALDDFRSWRRGVVELPPGPTVLLGPNGQGKTNLVEAIAYLSTFSSHRVFAEGALVRIPVDEEEEPPGGAVVRVRLVSHSGREQVLELEIVRGKANRARINRTQVRPRDILGLVRTVVFAPEDLHLIRGEPGARRSFLDDLAVQLHPLSAAVRADFERVARQRAALMKQAQARVRRGLEPELSTLDVWDERFADLSARVTAARAEAVRLLSEPAALAHDRVAQTERGLEMSFEAGVDRVIGVDPDLPGTADLEDAGAQAQRMLAALALVRDREVERGVNLVGAHRDDLDLRLGRMPVKGYASHGESWSVALALRLGAFDILTRDEETPILILDDVFAELDSRRRRGLAELASAADQVIVTAAVAEDVPESLSAHVVPIRWDRDRGTVAGDD
ncbi:DNA replication/repair protein RecF [Actinomyces sp. B33]|uniref:DNA replication/repair protein RecF n=1 Tax=Actinomyces sp. B33 TaxID=2942131 RepID=UPI002341BB90|nr:DNA replication/repair protein RecF [Actinomyces sp. B33]MDC4232547.1 DNA replication/repair protein RecF [Actinomyces sp. B33]